MLAMSLRIAQQVPYFFWLLCLLSAFPLTILAQEALNPGLQLRENPPMQTFSRTPPPPPSVTEEYEVREGFTLLDTLDEFRLAIKQDAQKIRLKPGVYRATSADPPVGKDQHLFAVTGSGNHFDLRGVVIETPVSVQGVLSDAAHVSDTWHIFGDNNLFEGGYFINLLDQPYPEYNVTENEFEVLGNGNTFSDGVFVIRGSIPYGYTDYYGKGGPNYGRLDKHAFMSIAGARNTSLVGCQIYMESFGHGVHLHGARGVRIEDCLLSGTLRPTSDIYRETAGRAAKYAFNTMYRDKRPIPRDGVIPLTEDGIRTYGGDRDITIVNSTIERFRGCIQVHSEGHVTLENVTVREAGDFAFDVSAGSSGKTVVKNCSADVAYNPVFNLTRGGKPEDAIYEVTILSPEQGVKPTPRSSLGQICGANCTFILKDGATRPIPQEANRLMCGGRRGLTNSTVKNYTAAKLILDHRVRGCRIESVGPVEDGGEDNEIVRVRPQ